MVGAAPSPLPMGMSMDLVFTMDLAFTIYYGLSVCKVQSTKIIGGKSMDLAYHPMYHGPLPLLPMGMSMDLAFAMYYGPKSVMECRRGGFEEVFILFNEMIAGKCIISLNICTSFAKGAKTYYPTHYLFYSFFSCNQLFFSFQIKDPQLPCDICRVKDHTSCLFSYLISVAKVTI